MSKAGSVVRITAADIRLALKKHFVGRGNGDQANAAIVYEVAQSTGYSAHRHLDAVAMELWPSRGFALHGVEIKVSLSDWRREQADPAKAEQIARFTDFFWVAAPAGLIPLADIPMAWGLLELGADETMKVVKPAVKTAAQDVDRAFLAAMLRAATRKIDPESLAAMLAKRQQEMEDDFQRRVNEEAKRRTDRQDRDGASWRKFVEAVGDEAATRYTDDEALIRAAKVVYKAGFAGTWSGLNSLHQTLSSALDKVAEAAAEMGIETTKPKAKRAAR